jgi:hypothetical protein
LRQLFQSSVHHAAPSALAKINASVDGTLDVARPVRQLLSERLSQVDSAVDPIRLLALEAAVVDGLLNEQRAFPHVAPFEPRAPRPDEGRRKRGR